MNAKLYIKTLFQSNYLAMHSAIEEFRLWSKSSGKIGLPHVVTTNIEHCATELPLKHWMERGLIGERSRNIRILK